VQEALSVLGRQLQAADKLSLVCFARTARLWADGVSGGDAVRSLAESANVPAEGGTNLEEALALGYDTARRHYLAGGINRVVLLTDGAANLGNVNAQALQRTVEAHRQQGIALDCFGVGWEGYNDELLQILSSHGDGRYGFLNTPEEAASSFASQLAGALQVAAADVKVQVEFNPKRVSSFRQVGYASHQLTAEQFRNNAVDAAELGGAESGTAIYVVQVNTRGEGPIADLRVRYKVPGTTDYREQQWTVPYTGAAGSLEAAGSALRLAVAASAFSEWLVSSPFAAEVTPDSLLRLLSGVPQAYSSDERPKKLEWMIRQAASLK
jgi:secreted protein with Ig-like and vWFA domain